MTFDKTRNAEWQTERRVALANDPRVQAMKQVLIVVAGCAGVVGCSLFVEHPSGVMWCNSEHPCPHGYSCDMFGCVRNGSVGPGEGCGRPIECAGYPDYTCGAEPFTCRKVCGDLLGAGGCDAGEYCRPEESRDWTEWVGTCMESECSALEGCAGAACVAVTSSVNACLERCEIVVAGNVYEDSCNDPAPRYRFCQPVGQADQPTLVCLWRLEPTKAGPGPGEACDPWANPCGAGSACMGPSGSAICRAYCRTANSDSDCTSLGAGHCCGQPNAAASAYGVCLDSC